MCGIAGILSLNCHEQIDTSLMRKMTSLIAHRGPDDEGYLLGSLASGALNTFSGQDSPEDVKALHPPLVHPEKSFLGMGFRRLAILELSPGGHQPMQDRELGLAICFNGEIYNHIELREELTQLGYHFASHADTEVILKAYHAWGEDCVSHFIGMWAFALWDNHKQTLFCSRDRFGIKPFYYAIAGGMLYWGSEIKQLLPTPVSKDLNNTMIWRSMKINAMINYQDETYWQQIKSLQPGYNLFVRQGQTETNQYYSLSIDKFESSRLSLGHAVDEYKQLFEQSITLQMRSDVEVGVTLSGGMDSSAIACTASRFFTRPLQTFSSYYAATPELDERPWISKIVHHIKGNSHLVSPGAEKAREWWEKATWLNDLPVASGFVSQYAVMQEACNQGIKVLLSGQGSDEMNGGYRHAAYRYFADLIRGGRLLELGKRLKPYLHEQNMGSRFSSLAKIGMSTLLPESKLYDLEFKYYRFDPFSREFRHAARPEAGEAVLQGISDVKASRLSNFLYNMMQITSLQTLLHFEDRMAMGNSVESRVPFLDHRLVEFVFSLPSAYKFKPPYTKLVHRKAMKEFIPRQVYYRKDKGIFSSPFYRDWMKGELKPMIEDIFHSACFRERGIWHLPRIMHQWQKYLAGDASQAEMLYNVIALEIWFRCYGTQGET